VSTDAGDATGEQPPARRATLLQTACIVACGLFMVGMALVIAALVLLALSIAR
jgi:hypothetical protein